MGNTERVNHDKYLERHRRYNHSEKGYARNHRYEQTYAAAARKLRYEVNTRPANLDGLNALNREFLSLYEAAAVVERERGREEAGRLMEVAMRSSCDAAIAELEAHFKDSSFPAELAEYLLDGFRALTPLPGKLNLTAVA